MIVRSIPGRIPGRTVWSWKVDIPRTCSCLALLFFLAVARLPATEPPRTLNWIGHWLGNDLRDTLVREVKREYEFLHPEVHINLAFPQEIMGVRSKPVAGRFIADMIQSGSCPWDIIWLDDLIYQHVAEELGDQEWGQKYLVDFSRIPGFAKTQKPFILKDPHYRNLTGGVLVGPYIEGYYYTVWYNREVARKIGITIKEKNVLFSDLLAYVRAVAGYNRTHDPDIAAFYESSDFITMNILFQSLVKSEFPSIKKAINESDGPKKKAALKKTLAAFSQLGAYNPLIPSHAENIWFETRDQMLEDKALFYFHGTWMYNHWREIDKEKLPKMGLMELPVFQPVNHTLGGYIPVWAVMKNSPHKKEAIDFLLWWSRPAVAEKWVRYTKNPTGLKGNLESPLSGGDIYESFHAYITKKHRDRILFNADAGYVLGKSNAHLQPLINQMLRALLCGSISADDAYTRIISQCR